jgi:7-cyano-7-deazaguanine synthase
LIFTSLGALYAYDIGVQNVALGLIKDSAPLPDCTVQFCEKLEAALTESVGVAIKVSAPLVSLDKSEVIRYGIKYNFPYEYTYSCYEGDVKHCGRCPACLSRREAFKKAGHADPSKYLYS